VKEREKGGEKEGEEMTLGGEGDWRRPKRWLNEGGVNKWRKRKHNNGDKQ